jgi:hypothetical protein
VTIDDPLCFLLDFEDGCRVHHTAPSFNRARPSPGVLLPHAGPGFSRSDAPRAHKPRHCEKVASIALAAMTPGA